MVVNARDAALEDRKVSLNRIGVRVSANVLPDPVIDSFVVRESSSHVPVLARIIRHQRRGGVDMRDKDGLRVAADIKDVVRAHLAASLDERETASLPVPPITLVSLVACLFFSLPPM